MEGLRLSQRLRAGFRGKNPSGRSSVLRSGAQLVCRRSDSVRQRQARSPSRQRSGPRAGV